MVKFFAFTLLCLVPAYEIQAASLFVGSFTDGPVPAVGGGLERLTDSDDQFSDDTSLTGLSRSAHAGIAQGGTIYDGSASADLRSGALSSNIHTQSAILAPAPLGADNVVNPKIEAFESFEVTGDGSVELRLDVTGSWSIGGLEPSTPDFSRLVMYGGFFVSDASGAGDDPFFRIIEEGPAAKLSGRVSETLSFTKKVSDGDSYGFNTFFFSSLEGSSGDSSVEWSALLSVTGRGGAAIRFGDPDFLADSRPPAPVPLPTSGLLLLGAVAMSTLLRRQTDRQARLDQTNYRSDRSPRARTTSLWGAT